MKISNYDQFDYDYRKYWNNREYEDKAEKIVLEKYLKDLRGRFFVDIGGSFGRNLEIYYGKFDIPIILDYSIKTLQKNRENILKKHPKTELISANAYKMPFKEESVDTTMMIRVLHHLENQKAIFEEIRRITRKQGFFILEYANKMHIKGVLKWILTLKFKNFSKKPYQQPNQNNFEGTEKGETTVFLNYHTKYIFESLEDFNFTILEKTSCSFLRTRFLKKNLSLKTLLFFEKIFQKTLSWKNISPSIILKTQKKGNEETQVLKLFYEILCCPECHGNLKIEEKRAECTDCKKIFKKEKGVWDFRV